LQAIDKCWSETGSRLQELYVDYIRDIQNAWSAMRVEEVEPALLASVGNLLQSAASVAASLGVHPQLVGMAKAAQSRMQANQ